MVKISERAAKANKGPRIRAKDCSDVVDYRKRRPLFSLIHVRKSHCITDCEIADKAHFAEMLRKLSDFTWQELYNTQSHGLGCEPIDHLNVTIPNHLSKETKFIAFRFSGKKAMVGHRVEDVFHILWFDRKFNVYDHG